MTTTVERTQDALGQLCAEPPAEITSKWLDERRETVALALKDHGLTKVADALGMKLETLKQWRRRRGLAPQGPREGRSVNAPAGSGETVALKDVEPNPWQPRKVVNPEDLQALSDSIEKSGLLQMPIGRRTESGKVQLAFGHRRVEAIRLLAEAGKWEGGAPVIIKPLSDVQMAVFAMEENAKCKDINPLEQYLGYQKVIDDGLLTVTELAESVGLKQPTVSNNLRILKLPKKALEHFQDGDLGAHAARDLLAFVAPDHTHEKEIESVLKEIAGTHYGAPDWRASSVQEKMDHQVSSRHRQEWRPLWPPNGSGFDGTAYSPATFDIKAFEKEFPTHVHHIPHAGKTRAWTCNVREWQKRQSAATRAAGKSVNNAPKLGEREAEQYLQALKNDPVMLAINAGEPVESVPSGISMEMPSDTETGQKGTEYKAINGWVANYLTHQRCEEAGQDCDLADTPDDCPGCSLDDDEDVHKYLLSAEGLRMRFDLKLLTDQQIESAVVRALEAFEDGDDPESVWGDPPQVPAGQLDDAAREKLGSRAGFISAKGPRPSFTKELTGGYQLPRGFDLEECQERCTWGAVYAQSPYGGGARLHCTNAKCYQSKVEAGKERFVTQVAERREKDAAREAQTLAELRAADPLDQLRNVALALMAEQGHHSVQQYGGYGEADLWRERQPTVNVRELLGIEKGQRSDVANFRQNYRDIDAGILERVEAMDAPDLQELLVNLVAYTSVEHRLRNVQEDGEDE